MTDVSQFGGSSAQDGAQDTGKTYGSGLGSFGGAADGAGPGDNATVAPSAPPRPSAPSLFGTPDPSQPQAPQSSPMQSFGRGLNKLTNGPDYTPPDPATTALDQSADLLQQRIKRASSVAANPVLQFFDPEGAAKARDAVPQMTEQLQTIQAQKAKQTEIKQMATNYGINNIPQGADRDTAQNMIADELQARYLDGDPMAATGLQQLGRSDLVQAGGEQALSAAKANIGRYRDVVGKLSNMRNQGEYQAAYNELVQQTKDGQHKDHELASVPKTFDEFQKKKQMIGNQLATQQLSLDSLDARMKQLGGVTPIQKQVDKDGNAIGMHAAIASQVRDNNGNPLEGVEPVTVGGIYNGNRLPGDKIGDIGTKWGMMSNKEVATTQDRMKGEHATVERASGINKLSAITNAKDFSTNPFLFGHAVDQFVEISRNGIGGKGSATPGTIQMMENVRGHIQTWGDKAQKEWRQVEQWVDGGKKGEMPYVSQETKQQFQSAINTLKQGSDHEIGGVAGATAEYVGRHGGKLDDLGLEPGVSDVVKDRWAKGNQELKQDIASRPSVVMGGRRIVFDPGGVAPPQALTPGGFDQPQQAAQPAAASAQSTKPPASPSSPGAGAPPPGPPSASAPGNAPAGGGGPATIAGQQVTPKLPEGVTPNYLPSMQRIESGNEKDPWRAGAGGLSSASGAFQMIDKTWNANKPAGATAMRAKDATPEQQTQANDKFMATNAAVLKHAGIPVNDRNMYVTHNLGEGGGPKLLRASPNADARTVVGEEAAKNNPLFFKGRPTVATVLARYDNEMSKGGATGGNIEDAARHSANAHMRAEPKAVTQGPPQDQSMWSKIGDYLSTKGTNAETGLTPEGQASVGQIATEHAPAIGSTIGAVAGMAGGPLGAVAGGGAGGGLGQMVKDYAQGRDQNPTEIAKQTALGAVLGIAPEGRPLLATAARVGGSAVVAGGAAKIEGAENSEAVLAAGKAGGLALGGETLGRFVSSAGSAAFKTLSRYTTGAQAELSAHAGKLAEARATMASEQPKLPGADGTTTPNPKYEAAKKQADAATEAIKEHGQNPDDMVHAYEQAKAGTSAGEAAVMRPAQAEKTSVSQGYDQLRQDARETGVGKVNGNQPVPDGPSSMIRSASNPTGKVEAKFQADADHAEMLIKAPAKDWGDKWTQLQNAGTELVKKRLDFIAAGDKSSAAAMDELFQGVRNQQKAAATYVFGKEGGQKVIAQLESLDTRYAKIMNSTGGMKYAKMQSILASGNTPERRELEKNFLEFAKGDPSAIRAFNAMKAGAKGDWKTEAALMGPVIAGEVSANLGGVPTVGAITALVGGHRLYKLAQGYMNAKLLNRTVKFGDFLAQEVNTGLGKVTGTAVQRGLVQR